MNKINFNKTILVDKLRLNCIHHLYYALASAENLKQLSSHLKVLNPEPEELIIAC